VKYPLSILSEEHEHILKNLDSLENVLKTIESGGLNQKIIEELKRISENFLEADKHHKKEEDALFPLLQRHGIVEPCKVMRAEHEELRKRKRELRKLAEQKNLPESFKIKEAGSFILDVLRNHIDREENVLFSMAAQILSENELKEMKRMMDRIGYCSFNHLK